MGRYTIEEVEAIEGHPLDIEDIVDLRTLNPDQSIWASFVGDDHLIHTTLKEIMNRINAKTPGADTIDYLEKYMYAWVCEH